jgi:hypothetical protein
MYHPIDLRFNYSQCGRGVRPRTIVQRYDKNSSGQAWNICRQSCEIGRSEFKVLFFRNADLAMAKI